MHLEKCNHPAWRVAMDKQAAQRSHWVIKKQRYLRRSRNYIIVSPPSFRRSWETICCRAQTQLSVSLGPVGGLLCFHVLLCLLRRRRRWTSFLLSQNVLCLSQMLSECEDVPLSSQPSQGNINRSSFIFQHLSGESFEPGTQMLDDRYVEGRGLLS